MSAETAPFADTLDAWFARLDEARFRVGIRERLLVQSLFAQLATDHVLSRTATVEQLLLRVRPLLCTHIDQQREYGALLGRFLLERGTRPIEPSTTAALRPVAAPGALRRRWWTVAAVAALLVVGTVPAYRYRNRAIPQPDQAPVTAPESPAPTLARRVYVPVIGWSDAAMTKVPQPERREWLRRTLAGIGSLSALGLCWLAFARWRRQFYLRHARTDREIEERFLADPDPVPFDMPASLARRVASTLRRRYASDRVALDVPATLRATMTALGGLSPRYAVVSQTPEYVALIDRRHPSDHLAAHCTALVAALARNGVAVQVYYFEGSPQSGCWRLRAAQQSQDRAAVVSFGEIAARHAGQRLLVFSEAHALPEEADGAQRSWTAHLKAFPQRAWLTPMPLGSWGRDEQAADALGFLVLPVQPEALRTLADWFSADQLGLMVGTDWPVTFPPLLRPEDVAWIARHDAPQEETLRQLMFELRVYLGPLRFQWLCACAIFPAITPAITLALGRELSSDPRELALGMTTLGALPWFRYGLMPAWLRLSLLDHLEPGHEARFRAVVEARLDTAIEGSAPALLTLAMRTRRLDAWLRRSRGPARDVILVDFLQRGKLARLAQRLPDALRRRLFRRGSPAYGARTSVVALLPLGTAISAIALPGIWERMVVSPNVSSPRLIRELRTNQGEVSSLVLSQDGRHLVSGGSNGMMQTWDSVSGTPLTAPFRVSQGPVRGLMYAKEGSALATTGEDGQTFLFSEPLTGKSFPAVMTTWREDGGIRAFAGAEVGSGVRIAVVRDNGVSLMTIDDARNSVVRRPLPGATTDVAVLALSQDGQSLAGGSRDGSIHVWEARPRERSLPIVRTPSAVSALVFSHGGRRFVTAHVNGQLQQWDASTVQAIDQAWNGGPGQITGVTYSPDDRQIASTSGGVVRLWDVATRQLLGATAATGADHLLNIAFSPDGRNLIAGGSDGVVRIWGSDIRGVVDLVGCASPEVDSATVSFADWLGANMRQGSLSPLSLVGYTRDAWAPPATPTPPLGRVLYAGAQDLQVARALSRELGRAMATLAGGQTPIEAVESPDVGAGRFVANTCMTPDTRPASVPTSPALTPGPSPAPPPSQSTPPQVATVPTSPAGLDVRPVDQRAAQHLQRLGEARAAVDRGDFRAALAILDSLLSDAPNNDDAQALRTKVLANRLSAAQRTIAEAEEMVKAGRLPEAIEAFRRAAGIDTSVNVSPRVAEVQQRMLREGEQAFIDGINFAQAMRGDKAIPLLQKAWRYLPDGHRDKPTVRAELARLGAPVP
jgi:WD40 repeat protein